MLDAGTNTIGSIGINTGSLTSLGTLLGRGGTAYGANVYASFNYINAAGTTTIKSSAGVLHTLAGTYTGNGTLYNSAGTSAAIIWGGIITTYPLVFDVAFGSLTWAGTGASALTVIYT